MTLILDYRWEHALIAATIHAARTRCPSCKIGRTALQKLLYFMKVSGVPMKYTFDIHHFGPFCANLMADVEWLMADDVVLDQPDDQRSSNYASAENWPALQEQFSSKLAECQAIVDKVCGALSDLSPRTLELIATLDFSFRWVRARGGNGPWRKQAIEKFKEIEKDKFSEAEIAEWYETLVRSELIEA